MKLVPLVLGLMLLSAACQTPIPTPNATLTLEPIPLAAEPTPSVAPTPTPSVPWIIHQPLPHYSIEAPSDWVEKDSPFSNGFALADSSGRVSINVIYLHRSSRGWDEAYTVDDKVEDDYALARTSPGFRLVNIEGVESERRTQFRTRPSGGVYGYCETLGYGRHVLAGDHAYFVVVEMCRLVNKRYRRHFVERVMGGFQYQTR